MKNVLFWILGIIGVCIIAAGIYAYYLYSSVSNTIEEVYSPLDRDHSPKRSTEESLGGTITNPPELKTENSNKIIIKPVSILLIGVDEREQDSGRADSLMVVTLNAKEESMKFISIPRDTYTEIIGKGKKDKINHSYAFGGINMTVNTVENFLDIPVDYYIQVNMEGFQGIVDAVDGVDVYNDLAFTLEGVSFTKGNIHLNGESALKYTRMRKQDPQGDFGRQMRQRQVVEAIIRKVSSISSITNIHTILDGVAKNVKTNLNPNQIWDLQSNYKAVLNKKEEFQISGDGHLQDGIWYYFVSDQERKSLSNKLRAHLELPQK